jgi:hypothetical protein
MFESKSAPSLSRTLPALGAVFAIAATLSMLFAIPIVGAPGSAAPLANGATPAVAPATASGSPQWAYVGSKTITGDVTVTGANGTGFELQYHAQFGWTVIFTQTNTSSTTFQIEAQRTAGAELYVNLCTPTCANPMWTGNYTATAADQATAFGNFTRDGVVYVNGAPTPALGFLNGSGSDQGNLHSQLTVTGMASQVEKWFFNVSGSAQAQVSFTPELGLIPYSLSPGETWNSSALFNLSGSYALAWQFDGPRGASSGNPSGSISANGTLDLNGAYSQALSLKNGELTRVLLLSVSGPFDMADGVIVLPHMGNVFSGDASALGNHALGFAPLASTSAVDYDSSSGHLGIAAAATNFRPAVSGSVPTTAMVPAATSSSGGDIQAQPTTVAVAEACAATLLTGGSCATVPTTWFTNLFHITGIELLAAIAGIVGLVAVLGVAVGRRPRTPPPVRASSVGPRVPVGASGQLAPPPRTPPQPPSDPLGNLW